MKPLGEKVKGPSVEDILRVAGSTGVFHPLELEILKEVTEDCLKNSEKGYRLISVDDEGRSVGFAIFGRTPMTANTWDIYWLAVDSASQRKGLGGQLLSMAEAEILSNNPDAPVIRVETSSRDVYVAARKLYFKSGYTEAGLINDFYKKNDALLTFSKKL